LIETIRDPNADAARLEHLALVYKAVTEADTLSAERKSEKHKFFWTQITPLLTSTILAATLVWCIHDPKSGARCCQHATASAG
jgi:hypothetical protein